MQANHIGFVCPFYLLQVNWMIKEFTEVNTVEQGGQQATRVTWLND